MRKATAATGKGRRTPHRDTMAEFAAAAADVAAEEGDRGTVAAASSGGGDGSENYPLTVVYCGGGFYVLASLEVAVHPGFGEVAIF